MFSHSYSDDSHERANVNNMLYCIVHSSAVDEMTWQKVHRCGVVLVACFTIYDFQAKLHGTASRSLHSS